VQLTIVVGSDACNGSECFARTARATGQLTAIRSDDSEFISVDQFAVDAMQTTSFKPARIRSDGTRN